MRIEVLGPVRLSTDVGVAVDVAERKVRLLLAALVAAGGAPVSAEALVDRVWGENLPANPKRVLRAKLSQLRAVLDEARPGARELLTHTPAGYRLAVEPEAVDAGRFQREVERARRLSAADKRAEVLDQALSTWNGEPYADVADELWLAPAITELEEARLAAVELLAEALLESGAPERAIECANAAAAAHPTRERLVSALMLALYQAGRQHEALDLFEVLRHRLAEDVGIDPSPQVRELHGRILRQDPALTVDRPHALARTNVPAETAALIGRRQEMDEIAALLTETRLVTLTGTGGVGKTRLALHLARAQLAQFRRGTWFLDLTELASTPADEHISAERVAALAMSALDLPSAPADNLTEVCEALGDRPSLLVLDNCEHVVDEAAEFVAELLRRAPEVRVVATSRQPLGLPEEQRYGVAPLAVDAGPDGVSEAVAFFAARARAVDRTFALDGSTTEVVVELCRRLDGLPLALELAASRTNAISVRDLLERLSGRLNLLARPGRGVPRRQQTLRGMIDWSWSLLDETEQAVLRRLAVHPGGFSLEAAEAICADDVTVASAQVVDALFGLVDRSMVTASASGNTGVRYGLLESISTYAAEKLDEAGERERVAQRHLRYYLDFADRADESLRGPEQRYWLHRLEAERVQLRHASAEATRCRDGDSAIALALVTFWYQTMSGRQAHLRDDLRTAIGLPGKRDDIYASVAALDVCLSLDAEPGREAERVDAALAAFDDPSARAGVQWYAGISLLTAGIREAGERHIDEALPLLRAGGEDWAAAVAACCRDWLVVSTWGDPPRGLPDGRDAREVLQAIGDSYGFSYALAVEHRTAELSGDYPRAAAVAEQAFEQSLALHLWSGVSLWLTARAISALRCGDLAGAAASLQESRSLAVELGFANGSAYVDFGESMIARYHGETERARELLERWKKSGDAAVDNLLTRFEDGFLSVAEGRTGAAGAVLAELVPAVRRIDGLPTTARMLELAAAVRVPESAVEAAELLGAAEAVRARAAAEPAAPERRDIDRVVRAIRDRLDDQQVTEAIARGRARDPEEVIGSLSGEN